MSTISYYQMLRTIRALEEGDSTHDSDDSSSDGESISSTMSMDIESMQLHLLSKDDENTQSGSKFSSETRKLDPSMIWKPCELENQNQINLESLLTSVNAAEKVSKLEFSWRPSEVPSLTAVSSDGQTATYRGITTRLGDSEDIFYSTLIGNTCIASRSSVVYFEVEWTNEDHPEESPEGIMHSPRTPQHQDKLCVGVTSAPNLGKWRGSIISKSEDYYVVYCSGTGDVYTAGSKQNKDSPSSSFSPGCTIGCGVALNLSPPKIFFTKDGVLQHNVTVFPPHDTVVIPCITMRGRKDVTIRKTLQFDLQAYVDETLRLKKSSSCDMYVQDDELASFVKEYLLLHGHAEAVRLFEEEGKHIRVSDKEVDCGLYQNAPALVIHESIIKRGSLRDCIMNELFDEAEKEWSCIMATHHVEDKDKKRSSSFKTLRSNSSDNLDTTKGSVGPTAVDHIRALRFLKCVRDHELSKALDMLQKDIDPSLAKLLVPILAYEDPSTSPYGHWLLPSHRDAIASFLQNKYILNINSPSRMENTISMIYRRWSL